MPPWKNRLSSVLFWSVISAAFIGPGTVTTAARAGADFQLQLLWALVFSTIATIVLQEMAARLTLVSDQNLGQVIAKQYRGNTHRVQWFLFLAIALGCAAYQAGNMLGAIAGLTLIFPVNRIWPGLGIALLALLILRQNQPRRIAKTLGILVAIMGILFLYVALQSPVSIIDISRHLLKVELPEGSALLAIGLIGTTIVPYNLFLASGLSAGQSLKEMRGGLIVAVLLGGVISIAILIVGNTVTGTFSFEALAVALENRLGSWATAFFGFGLFAAGLSSSVTAPLATAITGQSLLGRNGTSWGNRSRQFQWSWGAILIIGLLFSLLDIRPIPAIILAQAINAFLLPLVAGFLLLAANDQSLLGAKLVNKLPNNFFGLIVVGVSVFLGIHNLLRLANSWIPVFETDLTWPFWINALISLAITFWLGQLIHKQKRKAAPKGNIPF